MIEKNCFEMFERMVVFLLDVNVDASHSNKWLSPGGRAKVNFLLDFSWTQGRLLGEYSIDFQNSEPAGVEKFASEVVMEPERLSYQPKSELPT